jgi:hypothetical protein
MSDPILAGLNKRRRDLVVEVRRTETTLIRLLADIETMDAAILQFNATYRPPVAHVSSVGAGGQITRTLLTILRKSPEPLTLRALTVGLMQSLGLDHRDRKRVKRMMEQCRTALYRQRANGVIASEPGPGSARALVWRVTG